MFRKRMFALVTASIAWGFLLVGPSIAQSTGVAKQPAPMKKLPKGFAPAKGTAMHASGYPMEIRCKKDGSIMVFVPAGGFVSGLTDAQVNKLVKMLGTETGTAPASQPVATIEVSGLKELKSGKILTKEDLHNIDKEDMQHQLSLLILADMQAAGKQIPQKELDRWRREGRTLAALLSLPSVQKFTGLTPQTVKEVVKMLAQTPAQTPAEAARARLEETRKRLRQSFPAGKKVRLGPFYIDKYEVTNAQYRKFFEQTNDRERRPGIWYGPTYNLGGPKNPKFYDLWKDPKRSADAQPVTCVGKKDAFAYAGWAGKRLPWRDEWRRAALGGGKRLFPWGNGFTPGICKCGMVPPDKQAQSAPALKKVAASAAKILTTDRRSVKARETLRILANLPAAAREFRQILRDFDEPAVPAKVGSFPKDVSPYGCYDMGGNVSEWVVRKTGNLIRRWQCIVIGGNAGSLSVEDLAPAQKQSYEQPGKLVGFRTVLALD